MRYKLVSKEMDGEQHLFKVVDLLYNRLWIYHDEEIEHIPIKSLKRFLKKICYN